MRVVVNVYPDGSGKPVFEKYAFKISDESQIKENCEDVQDFLDRTFFEMKDEVDDDSAD